MKKTTNTQHLSVRPTSAGEEALLFCVLAYALSWSWWGIRFAPFWEAFIASGQPISRSQIGPFDTLVGMCGPLIAAILMRLWISRESLRVSLQLPRSWNAAVFAVVIPTALVMTTILVNQVVGLGHFRWADDSLLQLVGTLIVIIPLATVSALGEEYGWRGYLLPRLLPGGEIQATLGIGCIWALWHLPLLITGLSFPGQPVVVVLPVFTFAMIMNSFLFTRLYWISGGSVWTAALLHGTLNALTEITSVKHYPDSNPLIVDVFGATAALILMLGVCTYSLISHHLRAPI